MTNWTIQWTLSTSIFSHRKDVPSYFSHLTKITLSKQGPVLWLPLTMAVGCEMTHDACDIHMYLNKPIRDLIQAEQVQGLIIIMKKPQSQARVQWHYT